MASRPAIPPPPPPPSSDRDNSRSNTTNNESRQAGVIKRPQSLEGHPALEEIYGLSEEELINCQAAWKLLSRRPQEIPQRPGTDAIVSAFLRLYDINIRPPKKPAEPILPSRDRTGSALMGGAMGALGGPMAVGISSHLNQQQEAAVKAEMLGRYTAAMSEYSAALQEWTTWKQWALGHNDWERFYEECIGGWQDSCEEIIESNIQFDAWLRSDVGLSERRKLVRLANENHSQAKLQRVKHHRNSQIAFWLVFLGLFALAMLSTLLGIPVLIAAVVLASVVILVRRAG